MADGNVGNVSGWTKFWCGVEEWWTNSSAPSDDPKKILARIKDNETLQKVEAGQVNLQSKYQEGVSEKGAAAVTLIQEALYQLGLLDVKDEKAADPACWWTEFKWGMYGDKTIAAVRTLQLLGRVNYFQPEPGGRAAHTYVESSGQKFGPETLALLKTALQAQAEGKDWRAVIRSTLTSTQP